MKQHKSILELLLLHHVYSAYKSLKSFFSLPDILIRGHNSCLVFITDAVRVPDQVGLHGDGRYASLLSCRTAVIW